jgi:recombinational DNA repair protein (RecF pathway)
MKNTYSWHGREHPRMQQCFFCRTEYDALYGHPRPNGICNECWPRINRIEAEAAARNAREES